MAVVGFLSKTPSIPLPNPQPQLRHVEELRVRTIRPTPRHPNVIAEPRPITPTPYEPQRLQGQPTTPQVHSTAPNVEPEDVLTHRPQGRPDALQSVRRVHKPSRSVGIPSTPYPSVQSLPQPPVGTSPDLRPGRIRSSPTQRRRSQPRNPELVEIHLLDLDPEVLVPRHERNKHPRRLGQMIPLRQHQRRTRLPLRRRRILHSHRKTHERRPRTTTLDPNPKRRTISQDLAKRRDPQTALGQALALDLPKTTRVMLRRRYLHPDVDAPTFVMLDSQDRTKTPSPGTRSLGRGRGHRHLDPDQKRLHRPAPVLVSSHRSPCTPSREPPRTSQEGSGRPRAPEPPQEDPSTPHEAGSGPGSRPRRDRCDPSSDARSSLGCGHSDVPCRARPIDVAGSLGASPLSRGRRSPFERIPPMRSLAKTCARVRLSYLETLLPSLV
jgi:hypothetical protein